ncbi:MAG: flagellar motor protein MotB [Pseudomonadota bacterium]
MPELPNALAKEMTTRANAMRQRRPRIAGGWLVTYADLMTILVCYFVLIVSYSIQDRVKMEVVAGSMRDAFGVAEERRYAGDVKLTGVPDVRQPGSVLETVQPTGIGLNETLNANPEQGRTGLRTGSGTADRRSLARAYATAKDRLEKAILLNPILRDGADAITVTLTPEGLQVLMVDTAGRPMFDLGAEEPTPLARTLLEETARALKPLPNRIYIEGHADASGSGTYSPFALTAARANTARQIMEQAGFPSSRIAGMIAKGDADPLYPEDPLAPANRRIEITLEDAAPLVPDDILGP